ncbi:RNA-directed DNA polymerase, eukaryota, reverse transcriptase zinc-binding domain protein, partial [Tanacetum coccineum]
VVNAVSHFFDNGYCPKGGNSSLILKSQGAKQSCLKSSRGSILVNGSPTAEFQFHKGLKQGDPLSPFLFILIVESLHLSFQKVVDAGLFTGVSLNSSVHISHLLYADDVVFLGQWFDENLITIFYVLECFFHASGLRINLHKSKLLGLAVDNHTVHIAANNLGCLPLSLPFNYLGVKVGARMSSISSWEDVFNKVRQSHLFNGINLLDRKATFIQWDNVLVDKKKGGLGGSVIKAIYGIDGMIGNLSMPSFALTWLDIVREIPRLLNKGIDLLGYIKKKIGNGVNTNFWDDTWKGNTPLRIMFPRMYSLESAKTILVAAKLALPNLCSSFRRTPRGVVEQQQFFDLMAFLEGTALPNMIDRWTWSLSGSCEFSVSSTRNLIDSIILKTISSETR